MNKNYTPLIIGIIGIAVIGGIYYWNKNKGAAPVLAPTVITQPSSDNARTPGEPVASTQGAASVSQSDAILNGQVNPNGAQTSYWYQYGRTDSLGQNSAVGLLGAGYATYSAPVVINNLASDTKYYFRIVAENRFGKVYGSTRTLTTTESPSRVGVPPQVSTRSATSVDENSATVRGTVDANGARTYYWFEFGRDTDLGDSTSKLSAGSGADAVEVSRILGGLRENTTYYYRLNAQNAYGTVNGSIRSFTTDAVTPPAPRQGEEPVAETGDATNVTQKSATLNGEVDPNGDQTTYYFEYGQSTLLGVFVLDQKTGSKSAGAGNVSVSASANISGLEEGSRYYYRLVAENRNGIDRGAIQNFSTESN